MLTLDHLVILVDDLLQAVADYEALGFAVTPGGTHADGLTTNALVVFADGTYLELIAFVDATDTRDNVWGWRQFVPLGGGLIDYCAASPNLAQETVRLRENKLVVSAPSDGGRRRPDGQQLRWRSARFDQAHRVLPFLIEDVTPRVLRVPSDNITHGNGVTGIAELTVMVEDIDAAVRRLIRVPGGRDAVMMVPMDVNHELAARTAAIPFGAHTLRLAAPLSPASALYGSLPGPFSVTFAASQQASDDQFDGQQTHGLRMRIVTSKQ